MRYLSAYLIQYLKNRHNLFSFKTKLNFTIIKKYFKKFQIICVNRPYNEQTLVLFLTCDLSKGIHALILFRPRSLSHADCSLAERKENHEQSPITSYLNLLRALQSVSKNIIGNPKEPSQQGFSRLPYCWETSDNAAICWEIIQGGKEFNVINIQTSRNFAGGRNYGSSLPNWSRIGECQQPFKTY